MFYPKLDKRMFYFKNPAILFKNSPIYREKNAEKWCIGHQPYACNYYVGPLSMNQNNTQMKTQIFWK